MPSSTIHQTRTYRDLVWLASFTALVLALVSYLDAGDVLARVLHRSEQSHVDEFALVSLSLVVGLAGLSLRGWKELEHELQVRCRAERETAESEQRYRQLVELSPDSHVVYLDGAITYVNPAAVRLFGALQAEQLVGKSLLEFIHPDCRPDFLGQVASNINGKTTPFRENRLVRIDGEVAEVEIFGSPTAHRGSNRAVQITLRDIRERKQSEVAQERARQAQKLEMLGTLAGGIAHDFNNLLSLMMINVEGASLLVEDEEARAYLKDTEDAVERASKITRKLLAFSRRQEPDRRPIDLDDTVQDIMRFLTRILGAATQVKLESGLAGGQIFGDSGQIEQVIMNLAINARDAMPNGGVITLRTQRVDDQAQLSISDTGVGMSPEVCARIFEAFFTTKGMGKGTGLGLSMVSGIVQQHGGNITVTSEVGVGTTFTLAFPLCDEPATAVLSGS
ncbi:MAG: PAS domain S-box protein [Candidatus Eremiobacteraeota bacterium]|nr:PAS domain S-box protein [Candidatus Eremiobacteraeota bacterium]